MIAVERASHSREQCCDWKGNVAESCCRNVVAHSQDAAFVQLRGVLAANTELTQRVTKLERGQESLGGFVAGMMRTIHQMQNVPQTQAIGFFELKENKK